MINEIVKERMMLTGTTSAALAAAVGTTPNQLSLFINGKGFLKQESLQKTFEILGINLEMYHKRYELACKAAEKLKNKTVDDILSISKQEMAQLTDLPEINYFLDVTEEELSKIVEYGVVDYESTYIYFQTMVAHIKQIGNKPTSKNVDDSIVTLSNKVYDSALLPAIGIGAISVISLALGLMLHDKSFSKAKASAMSPFLAIARKLIK